MHNNYNNNNNHFIQVSMDLAKHSGFTNNFNGFSQHLQRVVQRFQNFQRGPTGNPTLSQRFKPFHGKALVYVFPRAVTIEETTNQTDSQQIKSNQMLFFLVEEKTGGPGEKTSQSRVENQQTNK